MIRRFIQNTLNKFGFAIISFDNVGLFKQFQRQSLIVDVLYPEITLAADSQSQRGQELLVMALLSPKNDGFFVEFGAVDGILNSNTLILEKKLGWRGIVAEAANRWQTELKANRKCCVDTRCVWSVSGHYLEFAETKQWADGSTIRHFQNADGANRDDVEIYSVETVSLLDLLKTHQAPKYIDFLSIDTEGSENEILEAFDFTQYSFGLICVEHNFNQAKQKSIQNTMELNGYSLLSLDREIFGPDDWFINEQKVTNKSALRRISSRSRGA